MPYLTNLDTIARRTGYPVKEVSGWKSRGAGPMSSVKTIVVHHTAGPKTGNMPSLNVVTHGRPGLRNSLCHYGLGRDGTIYVVAAGVSWHAGVVRSSSYANSHSIGIEAENTGLSNDSPWPEKQMRAYAALCRELCKAFGLSTGRVLGHKEVCSPPGRKSDPSFSMPAFRRRVAAATPNVPVVEKDGLDAMSHYYADVRPVDVLPLDAPGAGKQFLEFDRDGKWYVGLVGGGAEGQECVVTIRLRFRNDEVPNELTWGRVSCMSYNDDTTLHYDYGAASFAFSKWPSLPGREVTVTVAGKAYDGKYLRFPIEVPVGLFIEDGRAEVLYKA